MAVLPCPPGPTSATTDGPSRPSAASSNASSASRPKKTNGSEVQCKMRGDRFIPNHHSREETVTHLGLLEEGANLVGRLDSDGEAMAFLQQRKLRLSADCLDGLGRDGSRESYLQHVHHRSAGHFHPGFRPDLFEPG